MGEIPTEWVAVQMQLLTGMYNARFDEKGRLSLPARLRTALAAEQVVILPGLDENHLMLMTPEYFEKEFSGPILSSPMAMLDKKKRSLIRKLISPAQYVDIDSSGRINIPLKDREKYSLPNKGEALLVGTGYAVEIWNPEVYQGFLDDEPIADLAQSLYEEKE